MGRRPKTVAELKLHGGYRPDRHADRDTTPPAGEPVKPRHLVGEASAEWNRIVPELIRRGLVGAVDTSLIVAACEAWQLYRLTFAKAKRSPADKPLRAAVLAYQAAYVTCLRALAAPPIERVRVRSVGKEEEGSGKATISAFARKRGG